MKMVFDEIGCDWAIVAEIVPNTESTRGQPLDEAVYDMAAAINKALGRNAVTIKE